MATSSPFAELLKARRQDVRLTQEKLAETTGFSVVYIIKLEAGERRPPPATAARLATALELEGAERELFLRLAATKAGPVYNLPPVITACLGREGPLALAERQLRLPAVRLLTFKGAPGIGKTRLAIELAGRLRDTFIDGVIFVDLSSVRHADQVLDTIAQARGVGADRRTLGAVPAGERLVQALAAKRALLLLDNIEQVVAVGPQLLALLNDCPRLKILTTSRRELQVSGEYLLAVPPLPLPDPSGALTLAAARQSPAVALFEARAREISADFALTAANCDAVVAICAALGGIPLAIRLAAVRVPMLPLRSLQERLVRPLELLTAGPRDLPERQQTLAGALAWSYDLLTPPERALFRRLGAFVGSFPLSAIEAVQGVEQALGQPEGAAACLDTLAALVAHSLVERGADDAGEPRYAMLKVIGDFVALRLRAEPEARAVRARHADYYLARITAPAPAPTDPAHEAHFLRIDGDYPNLLAALEWASDDGSGELAARLCVALLPFWHQRCFWNDGRRWIERVLAQSEALPADLRGQLLRHGGLMARRQSDYRRAEELFAAFLERCREADDAHGSAYALNQLGLLAMHRGADAEAQAYFADSLERWRTLGSESNRVAVLGNLASLADAQGRYAEALARHAELLALRTQRGDLVGIARTCCNMGMVALHQGDLAQADALFSASLAHAQTLGHLNLQIVASGNLGLCRVYQGRHAEAEPLLRQTLQAYLRMGDPRGVAYALEACACATASSAAPERAARLFGAAAALREQLGTPLSHADQQLYAPLLGRVRATLGAATFAEALDAGRRLPVAAAVAEAMGR